MPILPEWLAGRWPSIPAGLATEMAAGTSYLQGVYSSDVKAALGLDQATMNTLATVGNLGGYFCLHAGVFYDMVGPRGTMLVGAALSGLGYGLYSMLVSKQIELSMPLLYFAVFAWSHGNSWSDTAAVSTNVSNNPADRGLMIGLIKATFGLSAGVLTIVYRSFFLGNVVALLRFLAILGPVVFTVSSLFYRALPPSETKPATPLEKRKMYLTYAAAAVIAIFVTAVSALDNFHKLSDLKPFCYAILVLLLPLAMPALPARLFDWQCLRGKCGVPAHGGSDATQHLELDGHGSAAAGGGAGMLSLSASSGDTSLPLLSSTAIGGAAGAAGGSKRGISLEHSSSLTAPLLVEGADGGRISVGGAGARPGVVVLSAGGAAAAISGSSGSSMPGPGLLHLQSAGDTSFDSLHGDSLVGSGGDPSLPAPTSVLAALGSGGFNTSVLSTTVASSMATARGYAPPASPPSHGSDAAAGYGPFMSPTSVYTANGNDERARRRRETAAAIAAATARPVTGASMLEALLSLDFWLIMYLLFAGTGSGIVLINQLSFLAQSLEPIDTSASDLASAQDLDVALLSVFNCLGRMFFGLASDASARYMSRASWLAVAMGGMCASMLLTAFSSIDSLYIAALGTGFCYGGFWALGPSMLGDRFGARAFASIYAASSLASAAASYSLNANLATAVYDAHIVPGTGDGKTCFGPDCFRLTFSVLAGLAGGAFIAAIVLSCRLRNTLFVGREGKAIDYAAYEAATGHSRLVRAVQACLLPRCGCRCGRALVSSSVADADAAAAAAAAGEPLTLGGNDGYMAMHRFRHDDDDDDHHDNGHGGLTTAAQSGSNGETAARQLFAAGSSGSSSGAGNGGGGSGSGGGPSAGLDVVPAPTPSSASVATSAATGSNVITIVGMQHVPSSGQLPSLALPAGDGVGSSDAGLALPAWRPSSLPTTSAAFAGLAASAGAAFAAPAAAAGAAASIERQPSRELQRTRSQAGAAMAVSGAAAASSGASSVSSSPPNSSSSGSGIGAAVGAGPSGARSVATPNARNGRSTSAAAASAAAAAAAAAAADEGGFLKLSMSPTAAAADTTLWRAAGGGGGGAGGQAGSPAVAVPGLSREPSAAGLVPSGGIGLAVPSTAGQAPPPSPSAGRRGSKHPMAKAKAASMLRKQLDAAPDAAAASSGIAVGPADDAGAADTAFYH